MIKLSRYIERIEVKNLFGYCNYSIEIPEDDLTENPLLIIYGENGSGKTTILEILSYVLSTTDGAGHKSKIAKIKFESFKVFIRGDIEISAERALPNLIGSYSLKIKQKNKVICFFS